MLPIYKNPNISGVWVTNIKGFARPTQTPYHPPREQRFDTLVSVRARLVVSFLTTPMLRVLTMVVVSFLTMVVVRGLRNPADNESTWVGPGTR